METKVRHVERCKDPEGDVRTRTRRVTKAPARERAQTLIFTVTGLGNRGAELCLKMFELQPESAWSRGLSNPYFEFSHPSFSVCDKLAEIKVSQHRPELNSTNQTTFCTTLSVTVGS